MKNIECLYDFSRFNISFIASHFYMVDEEEFLKQSREIQYMIISHDELLIESEDSLFDIISRINEMKRDDEIEDILFLEQIELRNLSESKFSEFISVFDFNDMSGQMWQNLCQCFYLHPVKKCRRKIKCHQSVIVGGYDKYNQLGKKPNNKNKDGDPIIAPPVKLSFDSSSLLSYSSYCGHEVLVMNDGSLKGVGNNKDGIISATLHKTIIDHFTDFSIKDDGGNKLVAIFVVCCLYGTLYMFSKSSGNKRQLVLCDKDINEGIPYFLDIGNHHPVSLFGSCKCK